MYKSVILLMENKCIWRIEIGICNIIQAYQNFLRLFYYFTILNSYGIQKITEHC
jgi:hypothetical protein